MSIPAEQSSQPRSSGERFHGVLLLLWILSGATVLYAVDDPTAQELAIIGPIALGILLVRWLWIGVLGYERLVGLRIIRRGAIPRWTRLAFVACALVVVGGLTLLNFGVQSLALVIAVALAAFFGVLLTLVQYASIFGTTSIIGVVLGVAALIVVQSVATGFQHEFERRVLGVYAHINVTRTFGMGEYRRFESYLRELPGVQGASPFVYYAMMLAPYDPTGARTDELRLASVLVKGIEPETAKEVIDLQAHLERGSGRAIPLDVLTSDFELLPVATVEDELLPEVIATIPDPRGEGWYDAAMDRYEALPAHKKRMTAARDVDDDVWPEFDMEGDTRDDASTLPSVFIGATLARDLGLEEGATVMVVDPGSSFDHAEEPLFQYYRVAGIFQAGFQEYDSRLIYVHIKELQRFKYRGKDKVSGIDLRLDNPDLAPEVGAAIREVLPGREYSVLEWHLLNEKLFESIRFQKNIITVILSLVITVATFNVLSALWTMVVRRNAEVAILMSMGATGTQIARIFQVTGMIIGLAGSLAGVLFGLVLCWLVELYGYTLDPEVYFIEQLPVEISLSQIAWILGMTLAICFVATLPPSLRAARLRPVEGLRYE